MKVQPYESEHGDDIVSVDEVSVTYTQSNDCTQPELMVQTLTLTTRNNGIARFIHISTDGWSISDAGELATILEDFKGRAGL